MTHRFSNDHASITEKVVAHSISTQYTAPHTHQTAGNLSMEQNLKASSCGITHRSKGRPMNTLSQRRPSLAHERLKENSERVLQLFVEAIRREISEARPEPKSILRNSLPQLLLHLQEKLKHQLSDATAPKVEDVAREHAEQRAQLTNYSLSNVLNEYHLLRKVLFQVLREEGPLTAEESDIIHDVLDRGVAHAGQHYMELSESRETAERKRTEQAIRENERRFRTLANSIPQLAWTANPDGWIYWYNDRWYEYTGTTPEQMEGWGWQSVHDPNELPRVLEEWRHSISTGTMFDMAFPLKGADGNFRWFLTRGVPHRDADGKITGWFGTNTDIQAQKESEEKIKALHQRAEASLQARDEFLSIASHELKTPLTSLRLQVQTRTRKLSRGNFAAFSPDRLEKMNVNDMRQIERITRLIDDMLDISRINTGKLTIELERFDLCSLASEVIERYREHLEAQGSQVILSCCDPVEGNWDRFRIEQVLANLLTNAMKYGAGKSVEVSVSRQGTRATLKVRDHGIGIAKENLVRIFQRFERAVAAREISGLGLGLYITKQIVEMHGGSIQVESEIGEGSTFILKLPIEEKQCP
jgi:PAS domain S-box-containing protein